jgi:cell division protein FtsB
MTPEMKKIWNSKRAKQLVDVRNIGLYIFGIVVLAITWSGVKTVQANYELQKKISGLNQQNSVLKLENENTDLQNKYLQTDEYLDLSARQNLGLAAPGEKVLIVPKSVAMKYVSSSSSNNGAGATASADNRSRYVKNIEAWRDFLLGRKTSGN